MTSVDPQQIQQSLTAATDALSLRQVLAELSDVNWEQHPQLRISLARQLIRRGLARDGLDLLPQPRQPLVAEVEQLRAYGLANTGAPLTAARLLGQLLDAGHQDSETLGLLGRTEKDLARRSESAEQAKQHWRAALNYYQRAFEHTGESYPGINAAALSLRIGAAAVAQRLATQVLKVCDQQLQAADQSDEWTLSTKAEALLILGRTEEAQDCYTRAAQRQRQDLSAIGSTVRQARELLSDLGLPTDSLDTAFALPTIAVVTGHRIDTKERGVARFPSAAEAQVRQSLDELLERLNVGIGYGAAANGADLLFMEAMLARGGEIHLVLPMEIEVFRDFSVAHAEDPRWLRRFDQLLQQATSVTIASENVDLGDASVLEYGNRVALGLACLRGFEVGTEVAGVAIWDGAPGLPGGTGDCVKLWQEHSLPYHQIASAPPRPAGSTAANEPLEGSASKRVLMGMLFADIVGYSRLSEQNIERFYHHVLPQVAALCQQHGHQPVVTQSFGDAFYFVFESAARAADFAVAMNRLFREELKTFTELDLRIRIALHAGPLLHCFDPIRGTMNYTGRHTSRTARVEPVAPENQILATQQFAALLALETPGQYDLAYAGERVLPKGYGMERLFVLSSATSRL